MTAENELGTAMKIFAWRGPSRRDAMDTHPEATTPSPGGFAPIITETIAPPPHIEINLAGAVMPRRARHQ